MAKCRDAGDVVGIPGWAAFTWDACPCLHSLVLSSGRLAWVHSDERETAVARGSRGLADGDGTWIGLRKVPGFEANDPVC